MPIDVLAVAAGMPTGAPLEDPPVVELIAEDPLLRDTKMIAEAWDADGLNQVRLITSNYVYSACRC